MRHASLPRNALTPQRDLDHQDLVAAGGCWDALIALRRMVRRKNDAINPAMAMGIRIVYMRRLRRLRSASALAIAS